MRRWLPIVTILTACGGPAKDDSVTTGADADTDTDADTDADGDTDTDTPDAERPVITQADAWCYFHETGEQFYNWDAACTVTDPQGVDSLESGTLLILQGASEVVTKLLACNRDTGACTTTFREDSEGILCADATGYTFRFTVSDEDANTSAPVEVAGREQ